MKSPRWIGKGLVLLSLLAMATGCAMAPPDDSTPVAAFTLQSPAIPSATSVPEITPQPISTSIPTSMRASDGMEIVFIPAGTFPMGSDDGEPDEGPAHPVSLDAYWIDQTEVTNGMYALCVQTGACEPPTKSGSYTRTTYYGNNLFSDYPVIFVDWSMANAYCQWAGARLPTEAEWEKAARGANGLTYPWGEAWDVRARKRLYFADKSNPELASDLTADDGYRDTAPVGSYPAGRSPYGIDDLAGNAWEWVADWYDPSYYNYSPLKDPQGPDKPTQDIPMRSMRGGGWVAANEAVFHTYNRHGEQPDKSSSSIGFRCAR